MNKFWVSVIATSAIAFFLKFIGHSVPEKWLSHPIIKRTNLYIPIALLSALVAVQSFTHESRIILDHRAAGLGIALIALTLKAPFPVVVLSAALGSATLYNFF
ncbi:unannotated protein [freshwater metagenome]|uniref:Unannotated protein n=1 Tax=freshwater metagenome TaxID=449393 RepID=A0A6J7XNE0_9ZZZZ|nr:AzlD domain-containing protein [Actinomycetota bacterium]